MKWKTRKNKAINGNRKKNIHIFYGENEEQLLKDFPILRFGFDPDPIKV